MPSKDPTSQKFLNDYGAGRNVEHEPDDDRARDHDPSDQEGGSDV